MTFLSSGPPDGVVPDMSEPKQDHPSGSYVIDAGPHEGHTATIVARDVPGERFGGKYFVPENWVVCECGEAWGYVDSSADELAKDSE